MKTIKSIITIVAVGIACLLNAGTSRAQMSQYKFEQQFDIAFQYVLEGQHKNALPIFERLNKSDGDHAQVQYLYAVCEMKVNHANGNTTNLLENAVKVSSVYHQIGRVQDRTAPVKAWMYLAKSYAEMYDYDKAINAYKNYMSCIPMASLEHKRGVIASIKKLRRQKLADNSTGVTGLLAEIRR